MYNHEWFIRGTHTQMCQFVSEEDDNYRFLVEKITASLRRCGISAL